MKNSVSPHWRLPTVNAKCAFIDCCSFLSEDDNSNPFPHMKYPPWLATWPSKWIRANPFYRGFLGGSKKGKMMFEWNMGPFHDNSNIFPRASEFGCISGSDSPIFCWVFLQNHWKKTWLGLKKCFLGLPLCHPSTSMRLADSKGNQTWPGSQASLGYFGQFGPLRAE